jgi:hypothetical protein
MSLQPYGPRHWHLTREVKDRGECAACDLEWAKFDALLKAGALDHDDDQDR